MALVIDGERTTGQDVRTQNGACVGVVCWTLPPPPVPLFCFDPPLQRVVVCALYIVAFVVPAEEGLWFCCVVLCIVALSVLTCRFRVPSSSVMACVAVANVVKSSLGPVGLDKMLVCVHEGIHVRCGAVA